jgi:hypothetical protein
MKRVNFKKFYPLLNTPSRVVSTILLKKEVKGQFLMLLLEAERMSKFSARHAQITPHLYAPKQLQNSPCL